MSRNFGIPQNPAEQVARDACCWLGEPGKLWHAKEQLPPRIAYPVIAALSFAVWAALCIGVAILIGGWP